MIYPLYKGIVLFFVCATSFFLILPTAQAAGSDSLTVTGIVPLQDPYAECIERNSRLSLGENTLYPGEEMTLTIQLRGSGDEVLRGHTLEVALSSERGLYRSLSLLSDSAGRASIAITLPEDWSRRNTVEVRDLTYTEKTLTLGHEALFYILDPFQKEEKEDEEWRKNLAFGVGGLFIEEIYSFLPELPKKVSFSHQGIRERIFAKMRAGPLLPVVL